MLAGSGAYNSDGDGGVVVVVVIVGARWNGAEMGSVIQMGQISASVNRR